MKKRKKKKQKERQKAEREQKQPSNCVKCGKEAMNTTAGFCKECWGSA